MSLSGASTSDRNAFVNRVRVRCWLNFLQCTAQQKSIGNNYFEGVSREIQRHDAHWQRPLRDTQKQFEKYARSRNMPRTTKVDAIESVFPGSRELFHCPLWEAIHPQSRPSMLMALLERLEEAEASKNDGQALDYIHLLSHGPGWKSPESLQDIRPQGESAGDALRMLGAVIVNVRLGIADAMRRDLLWQELIWTFARAKDLPAFGPLAAEVLQHCRNHLEVGTLVILLRTEGEFDEAIKSKEIQ